MNQQTLSSLIWSVADLLRGNFKQSEYGRFILPFTVLRRLDCVLASYPNVPLDTGTNLDRRYTITFTRMERSFPIQRNAGVPSLLRGSTRTGNQGI